MPFGGFPAAAFAWFSGLEDDNSRTYFNATRDVFEMSVREPLETLLDELADEFGGHVHLFRQHRDVRFTADKSPYKTRTYGLVHGSTEGEAAFYAQVSAAGLFAGAGYHRFASDQLERYRAAVLDDRSGTVLEEAVQRLEREGFEIYGEALKTAPRGFPRDHPRARLLRHKAFFGGRSLPSGRDGIAREDALAHVGSTWRAGRNVNDWLHTHVGPSVVAAELRLGRGR